jgi:FtsX-like permease family
LRGHAAAIGWYRLCATLRGRLGGLVSLAVVTGLVGGVAMAAMTAARRTDSSYPDYLASTNPSALIVQPNSQSGGAGSADLTQLYRSYLGFLAQVRHLPHVRSLVTADAISAATLTARGGLGSVLFTSVQLVASRDGMFTQQDRLTILQGRAAKPSAATEVVATVRAARLLHLHVGSYLAVGVWSSIDPDVNSPYRKIRLTVVGIGAVSTQIVQDDIDANRTAFLIGTPALDREFVPCCQATSYVGLRLAGGSRYDSAVGQEYEQLEDTSPFYADGGAELLQLLQVYITAAIESQAQRAIRPEAFALAAFAIISILAALAIGGQTASRQLRAGGADSAVLRALGASPFATLADGMFAIAGAIAAAALLAAGVAIGLSPLTLFGPVRQVEPGRGLYLDWTVLLLGTAVIILVLGAAAAVTGHRQALHRSRPAGQAGGSAMVRTALTAGLPASAVAGLRFALEPGAGRSAVPVRSVMAGAILAVTVGTATLTFGASLANLISHPALYGWNFNYALYSTDGWGPFPQKLVGPELARDHSIAATTGVYFLTVQIDGQTVPGVLYPPHASIAPQPLSGHVLDGPGQIVLGPATLQQLRKHIGDVVTVQLGPVIRTARLRIAGTAALPAIGDTFSIHPSMSTGAILPISAVSPAALNYAGPYSGPNAILVRLRPGVSQAAGLRSLQQITAYYNRFAHSPELVRHAGISAFELQATVLPVQRPAEIVNYRTMGAMPAVLAGGLAAGSIGALGVMLISSVRRRRRDFALLKTLGFTRGQLASAVAWQATAVTGAGLLLGIPLGIAAGRWLWLAFAHQLSAVPHAVVPTTSLALAGLAGLALANLVAAMPGRTAARTPAALVLRSE